jgi:ribosomal protein L11 methyltransferase
MPQDVNERQRWRIVECDVDKDKEELAGWLMVQLGANGCELLAADGSRSRLRATFTMAALPAGAESRIVAAFDEYGLNSMVSSLRYGELVEEDWLAKWKEGFEPFAVGERLVVCPPWHRENLSSDLSAGRQVVLIDPGLAFGTGFHETTQFCLRMLQEYIGDCRRVLDVGSGSGILSIACALLSNRCSILALETDPVACKNAKENFQLNGVMTRIELQEASTDAILHAKEHAFDLILANLTYEDHAALINDYTRLAAPGCNLIFAGILKEKADQMSAVLSKAGLTITKRDDGRAWTGFAALRE